MKKFMVWTLDDYNDKELVEILGIRATKDQTVSFKFTETKVGSKKYKVLVVWDTPKSIPPPHVWMSMPSAKEISKCYALMLKEIKE